MPVRIGFELPSKKKPILEALNLLVKLNRDELQRYKLPWLYRSGVRYRREPKIPGRVENWQTISQLIRSGEADCEDLAAARSAELQVKKGIKAIPWLKKKGKVWHVLVRYPDGRLEDPSRVLGMRAGAY